MRTDPADQLTHPWIARTTRVGEVTRVAVAPAALVPPDGGLVVEHREHWTEVYDWTYQDPSPLAGWRASGTGEPLPADHMAQWADRTAELVLADGPRRVLELGCGTGMLLERIAPHVTAYVGTDVAADVVARHQATTRPGVTVVRGAAHEARSPEVDAALAGHAPDCVLINSVTQCFPDLAYLAEVLRTAISVVAPGGTVVVGDVRHAGLHLRHWQDLDPGGAAERAASDRELLVDPVALASAALGSGRRIGIAVHAKTLSADTELSRYRFDAVLHVDAEPPAPPRTLEWTGDPLAGTGPVLLRGIPNARLRTGPHARTAAQLREELAGCDAAVLVDPADPELLVVARPAAAAVRPAAELAGPGRAHEPLAAFARARVGALSRRAIGAEVQVVLPAVDEDAIAAARGAGTDALPEGASAAAATAVSRLDEVALRAMADLLSEGEPRVDPRHAWIVRRWRAELAANEVPASLPAEALPRACAALGYPPAMAEFFAAAIAHLPRLLRDEVPLQALLFPDGEITTALGSYQDNLINTYLNRALADLTASVARTRAAPLRVLELGGGVGGSTRTVLDALGEAPTDYLFTDVSRFFLDLAESAFPEVRTGLLDINSDLAGHTEKHDLVIAANVLHNAVDVRSALAAVRSVLAPGGVFALIESTREHLPALVSMQFLMSPRPGESQAGSGDLRAGTDRIFLTEQQWWAEIAAAGLRPVAALPTEADPLLPLGQQLLVSCAATPVRAGSAGERAR
ncbi:methyltransferase [Saccharopolyspora sp. MS10]|uniref:methyltransferase n=1 Tax=Saccharopolyspora sp. MS10 TaxID=3385973 RepID=UPI00399F3530